MTFLKIAQCLKKHKNILPSPVKDLSQMSFVQPHAWRIQTMQKIDNALRNLGISPAHQPQWITWLIMVFDFSCIWRKVFLVLQLNITIYYILKIVLLILISILSWFQIIWLVRIQEIVAMRFQYYGKTRNISTS